MSFLVTVVNIQAVTLSNGTSYQNIITNLTINCTDTYYSDSININDSGITFNQFNRDGSLVNYLTYSIIETNKQYDCSDLPYISSITTTQVTVNSNLDNNVNSDISFTIPTDNIGSISTSNGQRYFIPNDQSSPLSLSDLDTSDGSTILTLNYDSAKIDTCNNFFSTGSTFLDFMVIIAIISIAGFVLFLITGVGQEMDLSTIGIIMLIVGLVLVFGMIIISNINTC